MRGRYKLQQVLRGSGERTLKAMLDAGLISRIGKGRSSAYVRKD